MSESSPARSALADRNLLFGILALQLDFIGRDALIAAMNAWVLDKSKPLGQILLDQGQLSPERLQLLEALVAEHLKSHHDDPQQSLGALSSASALPPELSQLADDQLQASLGVVGSAHAAEGEATVDHRPRPDATPGSRYRILRFYAKGGLGEVFVAEDQELHREVALKEIPPAQADNASSRGRFLLEAEITGGLEHPGIVPVYGLGQYADGRPFYAMRFIKGDNLKQAIRSFHEADLPGRDPGERSLALRQLLGRFTDVCNAVAYAHSRGVLHRDLKPGNIMLGKYGETLVVDWGLAKPVGRPEAPPSSDEPTLRPGSASGTAATQMGAVLGTPAYMSPEQAAGRLDQLGPASDIYSLGATLYVLLTGQAPFAGDNQEVLLARVQRGEFLAPRQRNARVPAALEAVCRKAMALRPEDRYPTALELAADVEHWLADEPVSAWREPLPVRARRWMKQHRVLVMASVTALLVGALSLGVATVLLSAKNDELQRANEREAEAYQQAQANFEMASQAVEDYLFKIAEDDRLKERDLSELRKKLVASAATFYQKFIAARKEDPRLEFMLGRAYYNLSYLHSELTESKEAVEKLLQAQAIFQRLAEAEPDHPEYAYYLGSAALELEAVYRYDQKRLDEAEKEWHKAMPVFEQLARQHPTIKKYRNKESDCAQRRALLLSLRGHNDQAEPFSRRAVTLQQQIVKDFPETDQQHLLSRNLGNLSYLLRNMNRQKEASQCLQEAIRINKDVVQAAPRVPRYRVTTGWLHRELFWNLRDLGDPNAADQAIRKAVEVCRELAAEFPAVPSYRGDLLYALQFLVERLTDTGKSHEAVPLGQEGVRVGEKLVADFPREPTFREHLAEICYSLARALHRSGAVGEGEKFRRRSIDLYKGLCKDSPGVAFYWAGLGTGHSGLAYVLLSTNRLAEAKEESLRALAVFEKMAKDYPSMADYTFRVAETCVNLSGTLVALGEPNQDVIRKGIAAVEPLLKKGKNARYEKIYAALKAQPSFSSPHPETKVQFSSEVVSPPTSLQGQLTKDDPFDIFPPTKKSHHKIHLVVLPAGKHYQIDLTGDFDTFLRLEDPTGILLLYNDDVSPPDNLNSRLIFASLKTSAYRLIATSSQPGATGAYTLKVQEAVPAGPPQSIEGKLIRRKRCKAGTLNGTRSSCKRDWRTSSRSRARTSTPAWSWAMPPARRRWARPSSSTRNRSRPRASTLPRRNPARTVFS
jgi:serine/threonine-protein kinase